MGDLAIQSIAQVLRSVFRDSDIVARLSGDEFGVIAPSFKMSSIDSLREKLAAENERISKEKNLPFILSVSVGCASFGKDNTTLTEILAIADDKLYEEKRRNHSMQKNNR